MVATLNNEQPLKENVFFFFYQSIEHPYNIINILYGYVIKVLFDVSNVVLDF